MRKLFCFSSYLWWIPCVCKWKHHVRRTPCKRRLTVDESLVATCSRSTGCEYMLAGAHCAQSRRTLKRKRRKNTRKSRVKPRSISFALASHSNGYLTSNETRHDERWCASFSTCAHGLWANFSYPAHTHTHIPRIATRVTRRWAHFKFIPT